MSLRLLASSLIFLSSVLLQAQSTTVWQIGKSDRSSAEFTARPAASTQYNADAGHWQSEWPGAQRVGSASTISFHLAGAPEGAYRLELSLLVYGPKFPALRLSVDEHHGDFFLDPKISYYLGDSRSDPDYSEAKLSIAVPTAWLHAGENHLTLSAVSADSLATTPDSASAWHYDSVALIRDATSAPASDAITTRVVPTVFFRQNGGGLFERVDAFVRFRESVPAGNATLVLDGHRYTASIASDGDFGEVRLQFEVPEWQGTARGQLEVARSSPVKFPIELTAERKWTVFVVPHTHVDIGYTDYQGKVAEAQARTLDEAADFVKTYPDFRFTTDGSWNLEQYLDTRSTAKRDRLLELIRHDKIGLPAQYFNLLTSYASLETLYRSLYYSKSLAKKYGLPFDYANITDVPTYTGSYPSVLASSGIKYWVAGANNDRAPVLSHEAWNEKSPFWWEGPDGKKVLFWYSRCYEQVVFLFGLPPQQASVEQTLPLFLQAYDRPDYKPDAALLYGTQSENTDLVPGTATFATEWNKTYAYPKLQYATFPDFFHYLDANYSKQLPTFKGDMSGYWEDGIGSDAYYAAQDRENQGGIIGAEVIATASHEVDPDLAPPHAELDGAWKNIMLFAEHTWASGNSVSQPQSDEAVQQLATKDNYAVQAAQQIKDLTDRSLSQLVNNIHVPAETLVVFNSLNWSRNAIIETDLRTSDELTDWAGTVVPLQVVSSEHGINRVRFLARDLPPVGYRCFRIRKRASAGPLSRQIGQDAVVENRFYRLHIDAATGAVDSIIDKELQRELVDPHSPYKFGQYLYVTGGEAPSRLIHPVNSLAQGELVIHAAEGGSYLGTEKAPWGASIHLHATAVNTPGIDLEIRLYDSEKKIDFLYDIDKTYTTAKEAVYFAFPVAAVKPRFLYASQQGWVDPQHDLFKGGSVEWFTIQNWMAVQDGNVTVSLVPKDAPLASFSDIFRGHWPGSFEPANGTLFSFAMNNYWHTNYRAGQGGKFRFRYTLTSAGQFDPAALTRVGLEALQQPGVDHVVGQDKAENFDRPLPPEGTSFLRIDAPNVVLVDWKLAEDGRGTIVRLRETAGRAADVELQALHSPIAHANRCNGVEDDEAALPVASGRVQLMIEPNEVVTVRLTP